MVKLTRCLEAYENRLSDKEIYCSRCEDGYKPENESSENDICLAPSKSPNCLVMNNNKCTQCISGYYV